MENEINEVTPELTPKPKRRSRRSKKTVEEAPKVIETAEVHYAALEETLEEKVEEVVATPEPEPIPEPEPEPEPEPTPDPTPEPQPVVARPKRQLLVRPMKKKQSSSRPARGQRKAR